MDYATQPIGEFLAAIASSDVAPAGGTAVAVVGAIGTSLCEMACIHSTESGEATAVAVDLEARRADLERARDRLMGLATTDGAIVTAVFASEGEPVDHADIQQAVGVPVSIAAVCLDVMEHGRDLKPQVSHRMQADVIAGLLLAESALRSAVYTVRQNLDMVEDEAYVTEQSDRIAEIDAAADRIIAELSIRESGSP